MIRDFNFQVWDKEKYNEYIEYLISLRDEKLEKFNKKIIPTKYKILGIKIPILKKIAKKISNTDIQTFFDNSLMIYFEEVMILGFVIGNLKKEETFLKYFYKFLFYIDNWAICDTFCAGLKITKKNLKEMWKFLQKYLKSEITILTSFCKLNGIILKKGSK